MSGGLLDRLRGPGRLSWRYSLSMVLITVEFHAGSVIGLMIALPEELPLNDARYLLVGYFVLSYWAVFY